ncbi:hypothetical protein [Denitrobacterium detoxificans]|nr:hypothetical protein [Denitrobacterium detoxificans]
MLKSTQAEWTVMPEEMKQGNQSEGQLESQSQDAAAAFSANDAQEQPVESPSASTGAPEPPADWRAENQPAPGAFTDEFRLGNDEPVSLSPVMKAACLGLGIFLGIFSFIILFMVGSNRYVRLQVVRYCVIGMVVGFFIDLILLYSMGSVTDVSSLYASLGFGGASAGGSSSGSSVF